MKLSDLYMDGCINTKWMRVLPYPVTIQSTWWVWPHDIHAVHFLFDENDVTWRFWNYSMIKKETHCNL